MPTKLIDNFTGRLTRDNIGDMNSGLAKFSTTFGNDPFSNINNLTWLEAPIQIDSSVSVIQDLIMCAKTRLESGITYVYAIGHTGRFYKIQVNNPATQNPDYDNPTLLATLTLSAGGLGTSGLTRGSSIEFFGATERVYFSHDLGVSYVNFDGTGETYINGSAGNTSNVIARPMVQFIGSLFIGTAGNANLVKIDSTNTVTNNVLSPGPFPNTYIRDLDVTPDGNYLQIIASEIPAPDMTVTTQDTNSLSSGDSQIYYWNGSDTGITSYRTYNGYSLTSNITFNSFSYTAGYDLGGAAIYESGQKILSLTNLQSPNYEAMFSTGNMVGFSTPEYTSSNGRLNACIMLYGQYDYEVPKGLFRFLRQAAQGTETDVLQVPVTILVSNLFYGGSNSGYANGQVGTSKLYFSTLESSSGTTRYKLYKFKTYPDGGNLITNAVYETQQETSFTLFKTLIAKKFKPTQVRLYVEPLETGNSFKIDLIGSDGNPISDGSKTFTVGTNCLIGQDYVWYTPQTAPTYSIGVRFTNLGTNSWVGVKLELDYIEAGQ